MCVNKRREPTTDAQVTRRAVRNLNFRTGGTTWGGVRAMREIVAWVRRCEADSACVPQGVNWPNSFVSWESSDGPVRPSLREMGAEGVTGAASRLSAA
ncbi:hypothetical protein C3489_07700 [Streptomyces sp. Ru71]|nr:hypothetical protein C3489_07700 [Streptomyces sp. Ru71]